MLAHGDEVLARARARHELVGLRAAHRARTGLDDVVLDAAAVEDFFVRLALMPERHVESGAVNVEGVGVLHDELPESHQPRLRALLVAELGLNLVPHLRQLLVRAYLVARNRSENLLVREAETEVGSFAVFEAEHRLAHHGPAPRLLPKLRGVERGQEELLPAYRVHLLAYDLHRALRDAPAERQERVNSCAELSDVAGAQKKSVRDDLGVRGVFAKCGDEIL